MMKTRFSSAILEKYKMKIYNWADSGTLVMGGCNVYKPEFGLVRVGLRAEGEHQRTHVAQRRRRLGRLREDICEKIFVRRYFGRQIFVVVRDRYL
jgi:hypothetical protein